MLVVALLISLSIPELAGLQSSYNQNRSKWNSLHKHWIILISNVSAVAKIWNQSSYYWSQKGRIKPAHLFPIWRKMHCMYPVYLFAASHHTRKASDFGSQCQENAEKCIVASKANTDLEQPFQNTFFYPNDGIDKWVGSSKAQLKPSHQSLVHHLLKALREKWGVRERLAAPAKSCKATPARPHSACSPDTPPSQSPSLVLLAGLSLPPPQSPEVITHTKC